MIENNWELLRKYAEGFKTILTDDQIEQFKIYCNILNCYNEHTNIVSKADESTIVKKHFIDSLAACKLNSQIGGNSPKKIIDIGAGGGFPGLPLIIVNTEWSLCSIDSVGKKTNFIKEVVKELDLSKRVDVINIRAEDFAAENGIKESFDIATARAVSELRVLAEYCMPFVKKDGYFIPYKGKNATEEMNNASKALKILGGRVDQVFEYYLPDENDIRRNIILIKKVDNTPEKYPRKAGIPKKTPL